MELLFIVCGFLRLMKGEEEEKIKVWGWFGNEGIFIVLFFVKLIKELEYIGYVFVLFLIEYLEGVGMLYKCSFLVWVLFYM